MAKRKNAFEEAQNLFGRLTQGASNLAGGVVNRVAQTPLINLTPAGPAVNYANRIRQQYTPQVQRFPQVANIVNRIPLNFTPTIGQYAQNQIIKPLSVLGNTRQPLPQRAISGVQGFSALTPIGAAYNLIGGGAAGAVRSIRTRQPLEQSVRTAMAQPTSLGSQGLGIKNPLLALGVDVLTGNPKQAVSGIRGVKGVVQGIKGINPRAFNMHPDDVQDAKNALDILRGQMKGNKGDAMKTVQNLLDAYAPGYKTSKNAKAYKVLENLIYKNEGEAMGKFPKMGIVGKADVANPPLSDVNKTGIGMGIIGDEGAQAQSTRVEGDLRTGQLPESPGQPPSGPLGGGGKDLNVPSKSPYFNTNRLNVPSKAKAIIRQTLEDVKPQIEQKVGKTLSNKEAIEVANVTAKTLNKAVGRGQTLQWEAQLLRTRQLLANQAQNGTVTQEYIDNLLAIKTIGTDIARKLQSFSINADAKDITIKDTILEAVYNVTQDADDILRKSQGVDFNDFEQASNFYRQFVTPKASDWIEKIRYSSMLSSPNTHINNFSSNFQGTGIIAPIEKTITGGLDWLRATATGTPRRYAVGEGVEYAAGFYSNLRNATHSFADVMTGKKMSSTQELYNIPLTQKGTPNRKIETALTFFPKLLQAADEFFTTLTQSGLKKALDYRQKSGIDVGDVNKIAFNESKKRLFNAPFDLPEEGPVLKALEFIPKKVAEARRSSNPVVSTIAKYSFPFVRIPSNLLKGSVEYGPLGIATLPGAANKTEQLSKAILGTSVGIAAATLISSDRLSWAAPSGEKQRKAFEGAHIQPYSIKIGDKWVSYSKLHPAVSFPLALVSAIRDAENKQLLTETEIDSVLKGVAKWVNFYADATYVKNVGGLVSAAKGEVSGISKFVSSYPQQVIPFRALMGWVTRIIDPYQRQADPDGSLLDKQLQYLMTQIPGLSTKVPTKTNVFGEPLKTDSPLINAVSPLRVTTEDPKNKQIYDLYQQESLNERNIKAVKKAMEQGKDIPGLGQAGASNETTITFERNGQPSESINVNTSAPSTPKNTIQDDALDDIAKQKVKLYGQVVEERGKLFYSEGDTSKVIDLTAKLEAPKFTGNEELDKQILSDYSNDISAKKREVIDLIGLGKFTSQQGETLLKGLTRKLQNIKEAHQPEKSLELTGDPVIDKTIIARQKGALTAQINEIVDYVQEGKLTAEQGRSLIDRLKAKNNLRVGGGRKKKINYKGVRTTAKPIKVQNLKIKIPKTRIPKYKPIKPLRIRRISGNI